MLSEVLKINQIDDIYIEDNTLYFCELNKGINIYELAYKCKEWANKQDYDNNCFVTILYENITSRAIITEDGFGFYANTEPEAIFKACEWILKETK